MPRAPVVTLLIVCAIIRDAGAMLPQFPPTFNMQQSTIAMPCNVTGYTDMSGDLGKYGIIDFDWSNAKQIWANAQPMNAEELLLEQAKRRKAAICPKACPLPAGCPTKAACPKAKTWVYRNFVKALPWYSSVREKLDDPAYSGFFLRFNPKNSTPYHVPQCDDNFSPPKCTPFYHDQEQTPGHPAGDGSCTKPCDCGNAPCGEVCACVHLRDCAATRAPCALAHMRLRCYSTCSITATVACCKTGSSTSTPAARSMGWQIPTSTGFLSVSC